MRRTSLLGSLVFALARVLPALVAVSCSSSPPQQRTEAGLPRTDGVFIWPDQGNHPGQEGSIPRGDGAVASCQCPLTQVCTTAGKCVSYAPAEGDLIGDISLLHQHSLIDNSKFSHAGRGEARFFAWEARPEDNRQRFPIAGDEYCVLDENSSYPYEYQGHKWPVGPRLGAGILTITVAGGPSEIELAPMEIKDLGWTYYLGSKPEPLKDGNTTYSNFFETRNLPHGAAYSVTAAGGPHVPAQTAGQGLIANALAITNPQVTGGQLSAPARTALQVKWSSAQPGAVMEITISLLSRAVQRMIRCYAIDDGDFTISTEAMKAIGGGAMGFQLRREVVRYATGQATGKPLHVRLISYHAVVGKLTLQ